MGCFCSLELRDRTSHVKPSTPPRKLPLLPHAVTLPTPFVSSFISELLFSSLSFKFVPHTASERSFQILISTTMSPNQQAAPSLPAHTYLPLGPRCTGFLRMLPPTLPWGSVYNAFQARSSEIPQGSGYIDCTDPLGFSFEDVSQKVTNSLANCATVQIRTATLATPKIPKFQHSALAHGRELPVQRPLSPPTMLCTKSKPFVFGIQDTSQAVQCWPRHHQAPLEG